MPLLNTPRQLTQKAELYHQLASLTAAGVGLISALELIRATPPSRSLQRPIGQIVQTLQAGASVTHALQASHLLPAFDLALIEAGENSGRLDVCFRFLSEYYGERARLARQILSDLAYPALILHVAVLVFPVQALTQLVLQGDLAGFAASKALLLVPAYVVVFGLIYLAQASRGERWRAELERWSRRIPIVGSARSNLALARLSVALESLLSAGVSIVEAWELAAAASGSPRLKRTVLAWKPRVRAGQTPSEAVRASGAFPELFTNLYATGELSGQLDDTLRRLYAHYREEAHLKLQTLAQWLPKLIYLLIALVIAYQIVAFWSAYFTQIGELSR